MILNYPDTKEKLVTCEYCRATNNEGSTSCDKCGAPLKMSKGDDDKVYQYFQTTAGCYRTETNKIAFSEWKVQ